MLLSLISFVILLFAEENVPLTPKTPIAKPVNVQPTPKTSASRVEMPISVNTEFKNKRKASGLKDLNSNELEGELPTSNTSEQSMVSFYFAQNFYNL